MGRPSRRSPPPPPWLDHDPSLDETQTAADAGLFGGELFDDFGGSQPEFFTPFWLAFWLALAALIAWALLFATGG